MTTSNPSEGALQIERLVRKHETLIRRFLRGRSGHKLLAQTTIDDLFQETVACAIRSSDTFIFRSDPEFMGWIKTIARRTIIHVSDRNRHAGSILRLRNDESSGSGVPQSALVGRLKSPSSAVARDEQGSRLQKALSAIPPHYSRVLTLYKLEGRALADVASQMSRSKGATCRLIARALEALRNELEQ